MDKRPYLQAKFEDILGSRNVYYQPPESIKMSYPAIVYSRKNIQNSFANDGVYLQIPCYEIVVIDPDPDSEIVSKISRMVGCRFDRHYTANGLNHDVFTLFD